MERFVGAGAVTVMQPGKFYCLQLSFAGLYLSVFVYLLTNFALLGF